MAEWVPKGGVSFEEEHARWSAWSEAIFDRLIAFLKLTPTREAQDRVQELADEAHYWIDQQDYAEATRASMALELGIAEAQREVAEAEREIAQARETREAEQVRKYRSGKGPGKLAWQVEVAAIVAKHSAESVTYLKNRVARQAGSGGSITEFVTSDRANCEDVDDVYGVLDTDVDAFDDDGEKKTPCSQGAHFHWTDARDRGRTVSMGQVVRFIRETRRTIRRPA